MNNKAHTTLLLYFYSAPTICQALFYVLEVTTSELDRHRPFFLLYSLVERAILILNYFLYISNRGEQEYLS